MSVTTERIVDPTIDSDWGRIAIMEVIEHWQRDPLVRDRGIWKKSKKLTRKLLWLLPESRLGEPIRNPLDGSPVVRPKHPMRFAELRRECELLDDRCYEIFDRYYSVDRIDGARQCIVCLGEGWLPITRYDEQSSRVCSYCKGQGVDVEVVS